jgi:hypothetical protein
MRRYARQLARDLGNDLSTAQQILVARAAFLAALCTHVEATILLGIKAAPLSDYLTMTTTLRRTLQALSPSLKRIPKDVSLVEYLTQVDRDDKAQEAAE